MIAGCAKCAARAVCTPTVPTLNKVLCLCVQVSISRRENWVDQITKAYTFMPDFYTWCDTCKDFIEHDVDSDCERTICTACHTVD